MSDVKETAERISTERLALFEQWTKEHPAKWNLARITANGAFHHYSDPDTDTAWIGFDAALTLAFRHADAQEGGEVEWAKDPETGMNDLSLTTLLQQSAAPSNPVVSDEWPEPPEGWQRTKPTYAREDGALRVEFVYGRERSPWCVSWSLGNGASASLSYHATPQAALDEALQIKIAGDAALSVNPQSGSQS